MAQLSPGTNCYSRFLYRINISKLGTINPIDIIYSISDPPSARAFHGSIYFNNRFYVIGGFYQSIGTNTNYFFYNGNIIFFNLIKVRY